MINKLFVSCASAFCLGCALVFIGGINFYLSDKTSSSTIGTIERIECGQKVCNVEYRYTNDDWNTIHDKIEIAKENKPNLLVTVWYNNYNSSLFREDIEDERLEKGLFQINSGLFILIITYIVYKHYENEQSSPKEPELEMTVVHVLESDVVPQTLGVTDDKHRYVVVENPK